MSEITKTEANNREVILPSLRERAVEFVHGLQDRICAALEEVDGKATFVEDTWERPGGGGGKTRVISNGNVFEKGGVNTSVVYGELHEGIARAMKIESGEFFATGISLVIHPFSPRVPTVHANYRYFEGSNGDAWFGGGADLTPYIADEKDGRHFHTILKEACAPHGEDLYPRFKKECDEYFYIHHRKECRGVGGIFYDYLRSSEQDMEQWFAFHQSVGNAFIPAYIPVAERHKGEPFSDREKKFQLLRRGRYVEFNLVYDRGTKFGLETDGRIESILMSLPSVVNFDYNADMEQTESEQTLMGWLREPREWAE
ncbi:MAG: oxygen-dependent coproporphyrinogen oxidase [Ignavibacteriae bacterium]|nr:oxygen-dependent coproporphyrinogen oxidase [Ignavibacteriota bacterium]MCB9216211.1 oxygen-dependent coproporphyrinogen oxidase [Ignavibacteria bacterium]